MNCPESQRSLQQSLDGDGPGDRSSLAEHLAVCSACRELYAAAQLLEKGLRSLPAPAPPADLSGRIVRRVLAQHQAGLRRRRFLLAASALAASLLVAVAVGHSFRRPAGPAPAVPAPPVVQQEEQTPDSLPATASLDRGVEDAGSALVDLTRQTADQAVGQGRLLLPESVPNPSRPEPKVWQQTLDPPARSLAQAGQGVSEGLQPLTSSARRAVDLFMSELPPMPSDQKSSW